MNNTQLSTAIKDDLYNELRWLLCSATQWHICDKNIAVTKLPPHMKVYAMDSVFLHARSFYEFFTNPRTRNERLTWKDYGLSAPMQSTYYSNLINDLHGRALHLNKNRSNYQAIKDEVVNIASDVLATWDTFSVLSGPNQYQAELDEARRKAISDSDLVASKYGLSPIFA